MTMGTPYLANAAILFHWIDPSLAFGSRSCDHMGMIDMMMLKESASSTKVGLWNKKAARVIKPNASAFLLTTNFA